MYEFSIVEMFDYLCKYLWNRDLKIGNWIIQLMTKMVALASPHDQPHATSHNGRNITIYTSKMMHTCKTLKTQKNDYSLDIYNSLASINTGIDNSKGRWIWQAKACLQHTPRQAQSSCDLRGWQQTRTESRQGLG